MRQNRRRKCDKTPRARLELVCIEPFQVIAGERGTGITYDMHKIACEIDGEDVDDMAQRAQLTLNLRKQSGQIGGTAACRSARIFVEQQGTVPRKQRVVTGAEPSG